MTATELRARELKDAILHQVALDQAREGHPAPNLLDILRSDPAYARESALIDQIDAYLVSLATLSAPPPMVLNTIGTETGRLSCGGDHPKVPRLPW